MNTIYFNRKINMNKPSTIKQPNISCPFCDRSQLKEIVCERDDMLLVKNKFGTLKDANMLVLIETNVCDSNIHLYTIDKLTKLLEFAITKWKQYEDSDKYTSVGLFKNKGLHSSGTIKHPHMQIIGFKDQDCYEHISVANLQGYEINIDGLEFNLSTLPKTSFLEYNIKFDDDFEKLARTVNLITNYIEEVYIGDASSYNFFFYNLEGSRYLKIVPRYPTSAINIGYGIVQIYDQHELANYAKSILAFYKNL